MVTGRPLCRETRLLWYKERLVSPRRIRIRLQPWIAALLLLPLGLGGADLHAARGADHEVVPRGAQFVGVDCDGGRERHLDSAQHERRDPCAACARSLTQQGAQDGSPHSLPVPTSLPTARSAESTILGSVDFSPARGRAPPLS